MHQLLRISIKEIPFLFKILLIVLIFINVVKSTKSEFQGTGEKFSFINVSVYGGVIKRDFFHLKNFFLRLTNDYVKDSFFGVVNFL